MPPLDEYAFEAEHLLSSWQDVKSVPTIDGLRYGDWESNDRRDRLAVMAWSGPELSESWRLEVHRRIGEACGADKIRWARQFSFYSEVYGQFYKNASTKSAINAIVVMPSRVPVRLRYDRATTRLLEKALTDTTPLIASPAGADPRRTQVRISSPICTELAVKAESLVWTPRPAGLDLALVEKPFVRSFGRSYTSGNKLFQADVNVDADTVLAGSIPALAEAWAREGDTGRVHKPLVHLWRLDEHRAVDVLVFETDGEAAGLVSMRWAREEFATFVRPHPQQAVAIRRVLTAGTRLFKQ